MKKCVILIIVVLLIIGMCSCNENVRNDIIDKIYEISSEQSAGENKLNRRNIINGVLYSKDDTVQSEKIVKINNTNIKLEYNETLYYSAYSKTVHKYFVNSDEKKPILIDENGKINSILYKYTTLNISETALPDEVLPLLKNEISQFIDVSYYDNVDIPEQEEQGKKFGSYRYLFYNLKNGYITDFLTVTVADDGSVFGLKIFNLNIDISEYNLNIDKEMADKVIELKVKDMYSTNETKYKSFECYFTPDIVFCNNELCIRYYVGVHYIDQRNGAEYSSFLHEILIPVNLINHK